MANALVVGMQQDSIGDDAGFNINYSVVFVGSDVPNGNQQGVLTVRHAAADDADAIAAAVGAAVRAEATTLGFAPPAAGAVPMFAVRKL